MVNCYYHGVKILKVYRKSSFLELHPNRYRSETEEHFVKVFFRIGKEDIDGFHPNTHRIPPVPTCVVVTTFRPLVKINLDKPRLSGILEANRHVAFAVLRSAKLSKPVSTKSHGEFGVRPP